MIQDMAPWRLHNEFQNRRPADDDRVFDLDEDGLLLLSGDRRPPLVREWREHDAAELLYAFRLSRSAAGTDESLFAPQTPDRDTACFLPLRRRGAPCVTPEGWQRIPPSALRGESGPLPLAAAIHTQVVLDYFAGAGGGKSL